MRVSVNVWKPSRWSIPFFSLPSLDELGCEIWSTRIDFQLGTNGEDANSTVIEMEEGDYKNNRMVRPVEVTCRESGDEYYAHVQACHVKCTQRECDV